MNEQTVELKKATPGIFRTGDLEPMLSDLSLDFLTKTINGKEEYKNDPRFSNSEMGFFEQSPQHLKLYKAGEFEKTSSGFSMGTMFEEYLLERDKFREHYVKFTGETPSNIYHQNYTEARIGGYTPEDAYAKFYSTKNKSASQIEKAINDLEDTWGSFITFKAENQDKIEYDESTAIQLEAMYMKVFTHKMAHSLLFEDRKHRWIQQGIASLAPKWKYKGRLDVLVAEPENGVAYLVDLKTTSKGLNNFKYAVRNYSYYRQLAIYSFLSALFLADKFPGADMVIKPLILAVTTSGVTEARLFEIPNEAIMQGGAEAGRLVKAMNWHQENQLWEHTKEYETGDGIEQLDYDFD